jgi:zinc/manganese transport system permease protein
MRFSLATAVHWVFRKEFLAISADPDKAEASGLNVRWWDFIFYMLFGLVVTSFVHIGGVLLVFSYLAVPAVCATYLVNSIVARFAVGWGIATLASGCRSSTMWMPTGAWRWRALGAGMTTSPG